MCGEHYKGLGGEVCDGWDCEECVMAGTVGNVERLAVLVTSFKAAVDASSSSSSSTESLRLASSSPEFSLAGSPLAKNSDAFFTLRVRDFFAAPPTIFLPLRLTAVTVALSVGFCIFVRCFLDAVQPSKLITLAS